MIFSHQKKARELKEAAGKVLAKVQNVLQKPEVREAGKEKIKEKAKESVREKLARGKTRADEENRTRWERQGAVSPSKRRDWDL